MNPFNQSQLPTAPSFGRVGLGTFSPDQQSLNKSIEYYRNLMQLGQLNPEEASKSLLGDYTSSIKEASKAAGSGGYAYGGSEWEGIQSKLFSPMKILQNPSQNMTMRQGNLTQSGEVQYENPYLYKSVTSAAGSRGQGQNMSGKTNEQWIGKPVVPYSRPAPKVSSIAVPKLY